MSLSHSFRFIVEGRGIFPYDMLRYDRCMPDRPEDTVTMVCSEPDALRQVKLVHYNPVSAWDPHTARWESFGWKVIECEKGMRC